MSADTPAMTDERLEQLERLANVRCNCGSCDGDRAGLTAYAANELLAEVKRLREENGTLRAMQDSYIVALDQASIGDMQRLVAERDKAIEERDLAIAHDRQPYPTAWAYEQACAALNKHRERADAAEAKLAKLTELTPEFGLLVTYTSTRTEERAIADTLGGALEALERFDAQNRPDVVGRELIERPVGKWSKVGEAS